MWYGIGGGISSAWTAHARLCNSPERKETQKTKSSCRSAALYLSARYLPFRGSEIEKGKKFNETNTTRRHRRNDAQGEILVNLLNPVSCRCCRGSGVGMDKANICTLLLGRIGWILTNFANLWAWPRAGSYLFSLLCCTSGDSGKIGMAQRGAFACAALVPPAMQSKWVAADCGQPTLEVHA